MGIGLLTVLGGFAPVGASNTPSLAFRAVNITGTEFLVIQNVGGQPLGLASYWLGYASGINASTGPSIELPDMTLAEDETIVLHDSPVAACGAAITDRLHFSLANSAGTLTLWQANTKLNPDNFSLISTLAWSSTGGTDAQHLNINDEQRVADWDKLHQTDQNATWYLPLPTADGQPSWQVGNLAGCSFTPIDELEQSQSEINFNWPSSNNPPFKVLAPKTVDTSAAVIPASDKRLEPPIINELLPNPAAPETDSNDEFIEIYNPNSERFDLSGFVLETGSVTSARRHDYKIPAGTYLAGKSYLAFKSSVTSISLSNSGGQVWLKDPLGQIISQSEVYGTAKDGLAFARAGQNWQWTLRSTPGAENIIEASGNSSTGGTSQGQPVSAIKGTSTTSPASQVTANIGANNGEQPVAVNPTVLALVAALALGYGLYEYRHDLSNKFHQFRSYRAARRTNRR